MAQIDFTNAVLKTSSTNNPLENSNLALGFSAYVPGEQSTASQVIASTISSNKKVFTYSGSVNKTGNKLCIAANPPEPQYTYWIIENISYSTGDTYSFSITVELPPQASN